MTRFASLITAAALLSTPAAADQYAERGTFRRAVQLYYASPSKVSWAVFKDACLHGEEMAEDATARAHLSKRNQIAYDRVADALADVYHAVAEPTDSNMEQIEHDFCRAADDR
jgi:hypothetical protein